MVSPADGLIGWERAEEGVMEVIVTTGALGLSTCTETLVAA